MYIDTLEKITKLEEKLRDLYKDIVIIEEELKIKEKRYEELLKNEKILEQNKVYTYKGRMYTATEIAKEAGIKDAKELNLFLSEQGIQYRLGSEWILYDEYMEEMLVIYIKVERENKANIMNKKWTEKGRKFVLDLIKNNYKK